MKSSSKTFVEIYADGACSGNPGVGGFGAILRAADKEKELFGCEPLTANNRMELMAVIAGLEALKKPCRVTVTTDSNYVVKGMTVWVSAWQRNGWRNSQKKEVMNRDLWERLLKASGPHEVSWEWIRGHNGHIENERCDSLARKGIDECRKSPGETSREKA
jgi:ribonuclease HI